MKVMKRIEVRVGQVWRNTTRGYRVKIVRLEAPVAHGVNLDSGRLTTIALDRFTTKCHWRLHRQADKPRLQAGPRCNNINESGPALTGDGVGQGSTHAGPDTSEDS